MRSTVAEHLKSIPIFVFAAVAWVLCWAFGPFERWLDDRA